LGGSHRKGLFPRPSLTRLCPDSYNKHLADKHDKNKKPRLLDRHYVQCSFNASYSTFTVLKIKDETIFYIGKGHFEARCSHGITPITVNQNSKK
jgi:hypothetical protein